MGHAKMMPILLRLLPFNSGASVRLRSHIESCEKCRGALASPDEARAATICRTEVTGTRDFWPRLVSDLRNEPPAGMDRRRALRRGWALAAAGALIIVVGGLLLIRSPQPQTAAGPLVKLRIDSVTIYGQPAQAYVFQTQDRDSTFVWVERQNLN